jgi:hypothetical protein
MLLRHFPVSVTMLRRSLSLGLDARRFPGQDFAQVLLHRVAGQQPDLRHQRHQVKHRGLQGTAAQENRGERTDTRRRWHRRRSYSGNSPTLDHFLLLVDSSLAPGADNRTTILPWSGVFEFLLPVSHGFQRTIYKDI